MLLAFCKSLALTVCIWVTASNGSMAMVGLPVLFLHYTRPQALAGSRFSIPGFFGAGFCQIPVSRDFSGQDLPLFLIPGLLGNFAGIFRDLVSTLCAGQIALFSL